MGSNYVFLCGVMWCRFGQQDAGKELLRATNSRDPDTKHWPGRCWQKASRRLRDLEKRCSRFFCGDPWGGAMWMRLWLLQGHLHKLRLCDSVRCQCGWIW